MTTQLTAAPVHVLSLWSCTARTRTHRTKLRTETNKGKAICSVDFSVTLRYRLTAHTYLLTAPSAVLGHQLDAVRSIHDSSTCH